MLFPRQLPSLARERDEAFTPPGRLSSSTAHVEYVLRPRLPLPPLGAVIAAMPASPAGRMGASASSSLGLMAPKGALPPTGQP
jgi:hypothetical protein